MNSQVDSMRELFASRVLAYAEDNQVSLRTALRKAKWNIFSSESQQEIRASIHALVFETYRRKGTIDRLIHHVDSQLTLIRKKNSILRNLLRIGVFRTHFEHHPFPLVTNTLIEISKNLTELKRFYRSINSIFHQLEQVDINDLIVTKDDPYEKLAIQYLHPTWLIRDWAIQLPQEELLALLITNNNPLPLYLRINLLKSKDKIFQILSQENIEFELDSDLSDVIKVTRTSIPIPRQPSYQKGFYYIQDKGSALVSHVLGPQTNDDVLDVCAAPGGKTTHISSLSHNKAKIMAIDRNFERLKELKRNIDYNNCQNVQILCMDVRNTIGLFKGKNFDKILIDAPCSGTGTFSRRPEAKWRNSRRDVRYYARIQRVILENCSKYLQNNGVLVYSTCSLHPLENESVISSFLKSHSDFSTIKPDPIVGDVIEEPKGQRLFPHRTQTEGFTIFKLQKFSKEI